jgi:DNA-binding PadR family transcriptional regulator
MGRETAIASLDMEMRRGTIVLCVLSRLDKPTYGYSLVGELEKKGIPVEANTLYPLLRRLASQGLLKSSWDMSASKPRKYYVITKKGADVRSHLTEEWRKMSDAMNSIIRE